MIWNGKYILYLIFLVGLVSCSQNENHPPQWNYGIIPKVSKIDTLNGAVLLNSGWAIIPSEGTEAPAEELVTFFHDQLHIDFENPEMPEKIIELLEYPADNFGQEGYHLEVRMNKILIKAADARGLSRGIASLKQLILLNEHDGKYFVPKVEIEDSAAFAHRGMLLDCCRHFFPARVVKKYIDLLALFKMNTLHWHLTEDQGWRVAIEKYPRLTEIGAYRKEADGKTYGGYYSKVEIREIVEYAAARHIEIIPEIEMPGHAQAAIAAYPNLSCTGDTVNVANDWGVFKEIYCAGNDSVFTFLEDVLTEVMELFPSKKIHIGGDEAPKIRWQNCPKCQDRMKTENLENEDELQSYFIKRIQAFLSEHDRELIGWDEIIEGGLAEGAIVQSWRGMEGGIEAAEHGRQAIMSPTSYAYFDYDLSSIDMEKVYGFYPVPKELDQSKSELIIGGECNMWTEHVPDEKTLDRKVFPRLLAMSEVLWSDTGGRDFSEFENRVEKMYSILETYHVNYGMESVPFTYDISLENAEISLIPHSARIHLDYKKTCPGCDTSFVHYFNPIPIDGTFNLVVKSAKGGRIYGEPDTLFFNAHKAMNTTIAYQSEYSDWYSGGGEKALLDSKLGSFDFRDGNWQGFWGKDLECTIDLGEVKTISSISANFFQYNNSWIFVPRSFSAEFSNDGKKWNSFKKVYSKTSPKQRGKSIETIVIKAKSPVRMRYVKLKAANIGIVPQWHEAAGSEAWIFIDEIVVQ